MDAFEAADDLPGRWLWIALAEAAALVIGAALLWVLLPGTDARPLTDRMFATLVAAAFLCLGALLRLRAPALGWFATVVAAGIAATQVVAGLRASDVLTDSGANATGLTLALVALVAAAGAAAMYASIPRGGGEPRIWEQALAGAAVLVTFGAGLVAGWALIEGITGSSVAAAGKDAPIRLAGRTALGAVGAGLLVGAVRDIRPAFVRAWATWRNPRADARPRPSLVSLVIDELAPSRNADRRRAQEAERARLAADLHAYVLPDLRRAAFAVASPNTPDSVRATVGRALEEVERLMQGRQSIVLEEFGLVAALEWLAERTEQAGTLRVELELEGPGVEARDAVPAGIARAAFRIALLAVDNVARHAGASAATIRLSVDGGRIDLAISDDGDGTRAAASAAGAGRGLADMATEARSTGGSVTTTPPPRATVVATWPGNGSERTA
ncbi:MAG TPA: hypothetical protein VFP56_02645 [Candidatus Limnocylindrales bacterium]|nr:hypothetical protein [Candidatus Limnocylindrales bacterium]